MHKHSLCKIIFLILLTNYSFSYNNHPIGARSASMGNTSLNFSDIFSSFNNQAGLSKLKNTSAGFSYENRFLLNNLSSKSVAFALPTKSGVFGVDINYFGFELYNESKLGLAFGKSFGKNFFAGIKFDYLYTHIAENYGNKGIITGEAGLQARVAKNLFLGVHVFNPFRVKLADYNNERIPAIMSLGLLYKISEKVQLVVETEKDIDYKPVFKTGLEYHIVKQIFVRTGISTNPMECCFGFGLEFKNFKIDFAAKSNPVLGYTPIISIIYNFK
ncbi:MAG: hypothetical protein PHD97_11670 [Bacteroidales bacterium]|nr:hypothetical protein [Bacteroidales bacterium]